MTFVHAKESRFAFGSSALAAYLTGYTTSTTSDTADTTALTQADRTYVAGLSESNVTATGLFEPLFDTPVVATDSPRNVELWHSRLGLDSPAGVTERNDGRRIVRAVWTRDRDGLPQSVWRTNEDSDLNHPLSTPQGAADQPFRGSLNRADRHRNR